MKAIILAAGRGKRMGALTSHNPKCMLRIGKNTIIERLVAQLRFNGVREIFIVRGYKSKKITIKNVKYFQNNKYTSTNMFYSLMLARKILNSSTLIIYADLYLNNKIINKMVKIKKDLAVAVDIGWKKLWRFRFGNINKDLESLKIDNRGSIFQIGKKTFNKKDMQARYIGIIKTSKKMNHKIISTWKKDSKKFNNKSWGISNNPIKKAYLTDLIQDLITKKNNCFAVKFKNGWYEFDNKKDYEKFFKIKNKNLI